MSTRAKRMSSEFSFAPQKKRTHNDESEEYKESIYQKTMQKLKDGAKLLARAPKSVVDAVTPTKSSVSHSEVKRGLKQISLNNQCGLASECTISNPKDYCPVLPEKCSFCERLGCFTALHKCFYCAEYFCSNCSFSTFITLEENYVCKSCFR